MATAKKAAAKTEGTAYRWGVMPGYYDPLFNDSFWEVGEHVTLESVVASPGFDEFMTEADYPEYIYAIATQANGKPHRFHRIKVKRGGFTFEEA